MTPRPVGGPGELARTAEMSRLVREAALELGFDAVGIAPADPSRHVPAYRAWLERGLHGDMAYLARPDAVARRKDPQGTLPGVRSVVVVADGYATEDAPGAPDDPSVGVIARYARGRDYPRVVKKKLLRLSRRCGTRWGARGGEGLRGHRPAPGAGARPAGRPGLVRPQHHAHRPPARVVLLPGLPAPGPGAGARRAVRGGPLRHVPGRLPHRGAAGPGRGRRARHGRPPLHLLPHHRAPRADPGGAAAAHGEPVYGCDICHEVCPWDARFAEEAEEPGYAARGPGERPAGVEALPGETDVSAETHPGTEAPC